MTTSARPPTPLGMPSRTGMPSTSSASSAMPGSRVAPPVITAPEASMSSHPNRMISALTKEKISSMRGWMMSRHNIWRDSTRGARPPTEATSMVSVLETMLARAQPQRCLIFSASCGGVRRPKAMSLVS